MNELDASLTTAYAKLVEDRHGFEVDKIVSVTETIDSDRGICDTCSYEWEVVDIEYVDIDGVAHTYRWVGTFADLIRELTGKG